MLPCIGRDVSAPVDCTCMQTAAAASLHCIVLTLSPAFSSDSVLIGLPASWPYLSLPSAFANRPTMDDMLPLDIEPLGIYVAAFFNVY